MRIANQATAPMDRISVQPSFAVTAANIPAPNMPSTVMDSRHDVIRVRWS